MGSVGSSRGGTRKRGATIACVALLVQTLAFVATQSPDPVRAAEIFVVDSTADVADANVGDGVCASGAGTCTLRAAIEESNATVTADTIQVPSGTFLLTLGGGVEPPEPPEPDPLASCNATGGDAHEGDLDITCPVTITGAGAGSTVVDGVGIGRVLEVHPKAGTVTIGALTITNGFTIEDGGGIVNTSTGTLNLNAVTVTENSSGGDGGGLFVSHGTTNLNTGTVVSNNTGRNGGGIFNAGELSPTGVPSALKLTGATVSGNHAIEGGGGGIFNDHEGALTLTSTTVSGNLAEDAGGGISVVSKSSITMTGGSITGNEAHGDGGGLYASAERPVVMTNVSVTGNQAGVPTELEAGEGHGGGLAAGGDGSIDIVGSTFSGNSTPDEGGGIYLDNNGSVEITDTVVTGNEAGAGGGGVENAATVVTFTRMTITDNVAGLDGGGIESQGSGDFTIVDTTITGNVAENGGGFANAADGATLVSRTTIYDNAALIGLNDDTGLGGGIYGLGDADADYENVTITGNLAQVRGGGFYVDSDADVHVTNSTIARNSSPIASGVGGEIGSVNFPIQPSLSVIFKNTIVAENLLGPGLHLRPRLGRGQPGGRGHLPVPRLVGSGERRRRRARCHRRQRRFRP